MRNCYSVQTCRDGAQPGGVHLLGVGGETSFQPCCNTLSSLPIDRSRIVKPQSRECITEDGVPCRVVPASTVAAY